MKKEILVIIPARGGSKRISNKNIRNFLGKPLIAHTILQAKSNKLIDRVIVDTDSPKIASVAKKYGAEAPYLRPKHLAGDKAQVVEAIIHLLNRLKKDEGYAPTHIVILQTTSPLREHRDIQACWNLMKRTNASTVLTIAPTHPRLYYLDNKSNIILANKKTSKSSNIQQWPPAYLLNGCFVYIVKTSALLKEKSVFTKNTKAVVCDKWRSIDLDTPEEWVLAEFLFKNKKALENQIKSFK
ncbi:MAG: N-acylneuraminate cytidylyltransferase [Candidatus Giovannonibacteria bacterium GW2011_GWC2_44_9]|uniref:N-acylneuraminate cytidylyltransferase n=3 Tax=Candidatus Giovannoniibacteriota TaxID=1752738 RepID=A0A0G1IZ62_9BACT|nr:MAG: N-acylneuraminate cytidylyltransferase [Candidatus Giovannonibacteria bacterium GW2011_GWB1_44_23]KKT64298.1 MAG: N-acylneuraminate cytidylyltransferase [Candidatus Giovannonibacteria bacterium GW2011_GWA1_44_29]KKT84251.1 MAG: N-acylneuraminate cytidylyltransferase [Candidatus Giovannonibacteria bacterium GW2011_GWC2_44_9]KKT92025.1 MAG: N-acylneuraminate cytidylyltransferase [Parcubacteria group bacterium GW2011_GWC1_45_13]